MNHPPGAWKELFKINLLSSPSPQNYDIFVLLMGIMIDGRVRIFKIFQIIPDSAQ